ncbi:MAG: neutral/alkaline non-lysosomal ceramidase N-terminal domain-containing protein [Planctomycetota bacterium]
MVTRCSLLSVLLPLLLTSLSLAEDVYRVGVAQVDITPTTPIRLRGYASRKTETTQVESRLSAEALAISRGSEPPFVVVTVDNCIVSDPLVRRVSTQVERATKLPRERLSVGATHTHNGPILAGMSKTLYVHPLPAGHAKHIEDYTKTLEAKLVRLIQDALKNRRAASLSFARGSATFGANRRTKGGPIDRDLPVLLAKSRESGDVLAVWTSYACHCTTLSHNAISGDWAGYAKSSIEKLYPGSIALVSAGCGGDQNPHREGASGTKAQEAIARKHGASIAAEIERIAQASKSLSGSLESELRFIEIPLSTAPNRAEWERRAKQGGTTGYHAKVHLDRLKRGEALKTHVPYPVQSLRFGDELAILFLGGEVVVDYARRLKSELDHRRLWVNAYSNDVSCYVPNERVLREGGYEGGGAMIYHDWAAPFARGIENQIIAECRRQIPESFVRVPPKLPVGQEEVARYTARRVSQKLKIDGRLDERAWQVAPKTGDFVATCHARSSRRPSIFSF